MTLTYEYGCLEYEYRYVCYGELMYGENKEEIIRITINRKNTRKYISLLGGKFLSMSRKKFYGYNINREFVKFLEANRIEYSARQN